MTTPVTFTIGPSKDYADPAEFVADIDVGIGNPVDNDEVWTVECYRQTGNASYKSSSGELFEQLAFATTCDATRFVTIKCASGESFIDNYSSGDPLKLVTANGVTLEADTQNNKCIQMMGSAQYSVFQDIQIIQSHKFGFGYTSALSENSVVRNLITHRTASDGARNSIYAYFDGLVENCLCIDESSGGVAVLSMGSYRDTIFKNCVSVLSSDVTPGGTAKGITCSATSSGYGYVYSCAAFGFDTAFTNTGNLAGGDYNASDDTSAPGTHALHSLTYANQFEGAAAASHDFRLKSSADLVDAGDPSNSTATDIVGSSRTTPDIGPFEYIASGFNPAWAKNSNAILGAGVAV